MSDVRILPNAQKKVLQEKMQDRVDRLARMVRVKIPSHIIGVEVLMIIQTGVELYGSDFFFSNLGEAVLDESRKKAGFCLMCEPGAQIGVRAVFFCLRY